MLQLLMRSRHFSPPGILHDTKRSVILCSVFLTDLLVVVVAHCVAAAQMVFLCCAVARHVFGFSGVLGVLFRQALRHTGGRWLLVLLQEGHGGLVGRVARSLRRRTQTGRCRPQDVFGLRDDRHRAADVRDGVVCGQGDGRRAHDSRIAEGRPGVTDLQAEHSALDLGATVG